MKHYYAIFFLSFSSNLGKKPPSKPGAAQVKYFDSFDFFSLGGTKCRTASALYTLQY